MSEHARLYDPRTSHVAASMLDLNARCKEVLLAIYHSRNPMFTDGDLAVWTGNDRNIVARRRKDLTDRDLVIAVVGSDGVQDTVLGRRNRPELLWKLSDEGYRVVKEIELREARR